MEEATLGAGEAEIARANRPQPGAGVGNGVAVVGKCGQFGFHRLGQHRQGRRADGAQEGLAVGEVPVSRRGGHADAARRLAQDDRFGTARTRQVDAGRDQRAVQIAMAVGITRRTTRSIRRHGRPLLVDNVHFARYHQRSFRCQPHGGAAAGQ